MAEPGEISREQIEMVREKYAGEVLSDRQIIDFVLGVEDITLDEAAQWYGFYLPEQQRPVERFSQITKKYFDELSDEGKRRYLQGASRLIVRGVRSSFMFPSRDDWHLYSIVNLSRSVSQDVNRLNFGQLLSRALEFCDGNIDSARSLLNLTPELSQLSRPPSYQQQIRKMALQEFFDPLSYRDVEEILAANPGVAKLAFWLSVDSGDINQGSGATYLFEDIFARADIDIKTEILKFANLRLFLGRAKRDMSRDAVLVLMRSKDLYQAGKEANSSPDFVEAYKTLGDSLTLLNLFDQLRSRKTIEVGALVEILEKHPSTAQDVSLAELEMALDATKDHGVALRLERIIRTRKPLGACE